MSVAIILHTIYYTGSGVRAYRVSVCNLHHYRDIAARNILLSADNVAKVANVEFAMKKGNVPKSKLLPIKWTAPEAIESRVRNASMPKCSCISMWCIPDTFYTTVQSV